jgi:hypothetical protein
MLRLASLVLLVTACAGAPPPGPVAPVPARPAAPSEPPASTSDSAGSKPRAIPPQAVPPPPAACAELVAHPTSGCLPAGASRASLAAALGKDDPNERDALLACLEPSEELPPGSMRALRAELAAEPCADALVSPLLDAPPKGMTQELENALLGLMISARLSRLLSDPPRLEGPIDKQRFMSFFSERLGPWVVAEALAIEQLSEQGSRLTGYGRGVAAIAAGNADLRFVQMVRDVPLPDEMKADKDVLDAYYGELDQALEPRKVRGRDAALVGLRAFAELGAVRDERVSRARRLLNELWSGSRIDALDRLLLPELGPLDTSTSELVLAARLPTFYAKLLLADADPNDPALLRALLERGIPAPLRAKLDAKKLTEPAESLYARALVDSGRRFFRAADFKRTLALLGDAPSGDLARLLAAVALSLENGPEDASELMLRGPFVHGTGVRALDAEVARRGRYAGFAAFDAALLLALAPLQDDAGFWDDVARRFDHADKLLHALPHPPPELAGQNVREFADAARATAATLRGKK